MKLPLSYRIQTELFTLRAPKEEDIPFIFSATRKKGFNDGMRWEAPKTEAELIEPFQKGINNWLSGQEYNFTIIENKTNQPVGRTSIRKTEKINDWNIGYWIHPDFQGKGIMTNVTKIILEFGFTTLQAQSIEAAHTLWNLGSEKVLKRNGFTFKSYKEHGLQKNGEWMDENILEITKEEFLRQNKL